MTSEAGGLLVLPGILKTAQKNQEDTTEIVLPSKKRWRAASELLQSLGYDPLEKLAVIAMDSQTPLDVRVDIGKTLMPYMYPRLQNVVVAGDEEGGPVRVQHDHVLRILSDPTAVAAAQRLALAIQSHGEDDDPPEAEDADFEEVDDGS